MIDIARSIKSPSNWLMIIGILISLIAFVDGINMFYNVKYTLDEANDYKYLFEFYVSIYSSDVDFVNLINDLPGNVIDEDVLVYIDEIGKYCLAELVLSKKEDFAYPIQTIDPSGNVIIGEVKEQYCYNRDGHYFIRIDGQEFIVAGIIPNGKSDLLESKLMLIHKGESTEKYVKSNKVLFCGSNSRNTEEIISKVRDKYKNDISITSIANPSISTGYSEFRGMQYMVIMFFSLINVIVISEYWIALRKREILIKRIHGFSRMRIVISVYLNMLYNVLIAFCVFFGIRVLYVAKGGTNNLIGKAPFWIVPIYMVLSLMIIGGMPAFQAANYKYSRGIGE